MTPELAEAIQDTFLMFKDIEKARELPPYANVQQQYIKMGERLQQLFEAEPRSKSFADTIIDFTGPRCPEYEPGCPCCDTWEAFDRGAFLYIAEDIRETNEELAEAGYGYMSDDGEWHEGDEQPEPAEPIQPFVIDLPILAGRTIKAASVWSDEDSSMSIVFEDGDILQLTAPSQVEGKEGVLHWQVEKKPDDTDLEAFYEANKA